MDLGFFSNEKSRDQSQNRVERCDSESEPQYASDGSQHYTFSEELAGNASRRAS